ncbi:glycoside hydrolase N-terminal domain-containing protein [Mucilaginibacter calamicampi]|uniref:Glycoside hydrolase N-terminal domain-containing protein n=1 Tax=Mucilaginibacter calamicampi TaxID=1302352 RepID=A0ABW2YVT7_9SPHI
MKKLLTSAYLLFCMLPVFAQNSKSNTINKNEMCWWYDKPATKYWEGLPIATGRFAAMVGGKIANEDIVFNDETLWTGGPYNPNNPNGPAVTANVRKLVLEKKYTEAITEAMKLSSAPVSVQHYQPMGILNIGFEGHEEKAVTNYKRKLSMDSALVSVTYTINGVNYKREIFASYPDQVIVMRITASKPGSINLNASLSSLQSTAETTLLGGDIVMNGRTGELSTGSYKAAVIPSTMKWQARLKTITDGGVITYAKENGKTGDVIKIKQANSVEFILAGATNWKNWNDVSGDEKLSCNTYINKATGFKYAQLLNRHLTDYMPLFASCKIDLGGNAAGAINTTARMDNLRAGKEDPLYTAQYFQYGRYLLLADAREGTLAFNNHNVWLNNLEGRWQGRWTLNINIQECYWPVENTNLSRLNESLLYFTEQLAQAGKRTAKELYNAKGWVAHHGTDVWFNTAPTDRNKEASVWPMGGAWLMQSLYDHYEYHPDKKYLARIYPLLKGSAEFFLDYLITDPASGYLVTSPSTSPENTFYTEDGKVGSITMGSTMDNELLRNLFTHCIAAADILKLDAAFKSKLQAAVKKLPPFKVGQFGQLQEWLYDYKEVDPGHRHISHLFASYPDDQITLRKTPELAKAVNVVLQRRGNINMGWSGAWKINQHARFEDGEDAYKVLVPMLTDVSIHPRAEDSRVTPSFEGNQGIQGVTAGIAEMLMQSHSGEISLLPALPKAWPTGSIAGLRGKGDYTIDIKWKDQQLSTATISSGIAQTCRLRSKTPVKIVADGKIITGKKENGLYIFKVAANKKYQIVAQL